MIDDSRNGRGQFTKGHISCNKENKGCFTNGQIPWNKGKKDCFSRETLRNMSLHNWLKNSEDARKKISESNKGRHNSPKTEFKKGQVPWIKNKGHSEESKEKIRKAGLGRPSSRKGKTAKDDPRILCKEKHPMFDKHHTEEAKTKMALANAGKRMSPSTEFKKGQNIYVGEKHPNWQGGISFEPYCPKFNKQLKEKIRDRDNRTCQLCSEKENGRKLEVHHVHYDKPNCEPDLICLCKSCHMKVNYNREHYETIFMQNLKQRGMLNV